MYIYLYNLYFKKSYKLPKILRNIKFGTSELECPIRSSNARSLDRPVPASNALNVDNFVVGKHSLLLCFAYSLRCFSFYIMIWPAFFILFSCCQNNNIHLCTQTMLHRISVLYDFIFCVFISFLKKIAKDLYHTMKDKTRLNYLNY